MKCPFCKNKTKIYNSRGTHSHTQTWRRHHCDTCKRNFTTRERIDWSGAITVKTDSGSSAYSTQKLLLSLIQSSNQLNLPPEMLSELSDSIELRLQESGFFNEQSQSSQLIIEVTVPILKQYNHNLALQYLNTVYNNKPPLELVKSIVAT